MTKFCPKHFRETHSRYLDIDLNAYLYYKLTNEPKDTGELKTSV